MSKRAVLAWFRGAVAGALAVLLTAASLLACVPLTVAGADSHCPPVAPADHCERSAVLTCCDQPQPDSTSLPGSLAVSDAAAAKASAGLHTLVALVPVAAERAAGTAPAAARGFHPLDLATLYSVFRI